MTMKKSTYIFLGIVFISLASCGPRRLGCGPYRCSVENSSEIQKSTPKKNPEVRTSGFV
jgi:hypothetical protein